jgi:hypothetical protein
MHTQHTTTDTIYYNVVNEIVANKYPFGVKEITSFEPYSDMPAHRVTAIMDGTTRPTVSEYNDICKFFNYPDTLLTLNETELIKRTYVRGDKNDEGSFFATTTEVLQSLLNMYPLKTTLNPIQVGRALKQLGFEQASKRINGSTTPTRGYYLLLKQ